MISSLIVNAWDLRAWEADSCVLACSQLADTVLHGLKDIWNTGNNPITGNTTKGFSLLELCRGSQPHFLTPSKDFLDFTWEKETSEQSFLPLWEGKVHYPCLSRVPEGCLPPTPSASAFTQAGCTLPALATFLHEQLDKQWSWAITRKRLVLLFHVHLRERLTHSQSQLLPGNATAAFTVSLSWLS